MRIQMIGRLNRCILLSYRTPADSVRELVPEGINLLTRGPWAFWNITVCQACAMRPVGTPEALGCTYTHVGYRLLAKANKTNGLFIVRSDANRRWMCLTGNRFTDFRFHYAPINYETHEPFTTLDVAGIANARLQVIAGATQPIDSCFDSEDESANFLKYHPVGLSIDSTGNNLKLAEVYRNESQWKESPLRVIESRWDFLMSLGQDKIALERACMVAPTDCRWQIGRTEQIADCQLTIAN